MRRVLAVLCISGMVLLTGMTGMQVAGDDGPDGNGSNLFVLQMAGDTGPDGNG